MKKRFGFLSIAALALVGAMMTGCSNDDKIIEEQQQPESKSKLVTLTTTVGLGGDAGTRALAADGTKTFAENDKIAVVYKKTGGATAVAVSEELETTDITNSGKNATFTVTLDDPDKTQDVTYIYPAAMAKADGTPNYDALATQDGTLASLGSDLDYCTNSGEWNAGALPTLTLDNQLAILAITLKNSDGSSEITSGITGLTVSDGTNTYTVSRSVGEGPIYVAIRPTSEANIEVTATDDSKNYTKSLASKTYEANNGYNVSWRMTEVAPAGPTTVTWNSSNVSDIIFWGGAPDPYDSYTKEGVTLRGNAEQCDAEWANFGNGPGIMFAMNAPGGYTFTAPDGKKFTKIEITATTYEGWYTYAFFSQLESGWPAGEEAAADFNSTLKFTWTGSSASVNLATTLNSFGPSLASSIEFTLEDAD